MHLLRARDALDRELPALARELPLRFRHRAWVWPLLFAGFVASGLFESPLAA